MGLRINTTVSSPKSARQWFTTDNKFNPATLSLPLGWHAKNTQDETSELPISRYSRIQILGIDNKVVSTKYMRTNILQRANAADFTVWANSGPACNSSVKRSATLFKNENISDITVRKGSQTGGWDPKAISLNHIKRVGPGATRDHVLSTIRNLSRRSEKGSAAKYGRNDLSFAIVTAELTRRKMIQHGNLRVPARSTSGAQPRLQVLLG